jgi:hypothetical protein
MIGKILENYQGQGFLNFIQKYYEKVLQLYEDHDNEKFEKYILS